MKHEKGIADESRDHTKLVIGDHDLDSGAGSVLFDAKAPQGTKPKAEIIAKILAAVKERKA